MATITNLNLDINPGNNTSTVNVSYRINFNAAERADDSVFIERVILMGDDTNGIDDFLITLSSTRAVANTNSIERSFTRIVNNNTLNEDRGLNGRDEIYARVTLTPFTPAPVTADSVIRTGNF